VDWRWTGGGLEVDWRWTGGGLEVDWRCAALEEQEAALHSLLEQLLTGPFLMGPVILLAQFIPLRPPLLAKGRKQ